MPDAEATTSPEPIDIGGWPTWLRRSVTLVVLVGALAIAVWGAQHTASSSDDDKLSSSVLRLFPGDGAQALRQTEVGADLAPGYDGRLTVNGIAIPEEQLTGAIDPRTVSPEEFKKYGVRPNNRNRVYFKPGRGKAVEEFTQGTVTISLRYFKDGQPQKANTVSWTIRVD